MVISGSSTRLVSSFIFEMFGIVWYLLTLIGRQPEVSSGCEYQFLECPEFSTLSPGSSIRKSPNGLHFGII